jgi:hypothetical protein
MLPCHCDHAVEEVAGVQKRQKRSCRHVEVVAAEESSPDPLSMSENVDV